MIKKFNIKKTKYLEIVNSILKLFYRKPKVKANMDIADFKEVIIVDFSLIGDMVMSIPFLSQIKANCSKASITMVVRPQSVCVLKSQGLVDEFIVFDGKEYLASPFSIMRNALLIRKVLNRINRTCYDIAIEPKGDLRHIWFMHHIKSNRSISYNYTGGDYLVTDSFEPREATKHLIDERLDLLEMAGFFIDRNNNTPRFVDEPRNRDSLKYVIGIHPGASCKNKMYRHFGSIIDYIAHIDKELQINVFCDPQDNNELTEGIIDSLERSGKKYKVIREDLELYIEHVSECNLMVCNDSSAGHIAAAYGIPVIVIFGPVEVATSCPRGGRVICICHDCKCKPCTFEDCPQKTYECIEKIDINEIYSALEKMVG